ncbi:hypothetical protein FF1_001798 [Malus domestica]
MSSQRRIPANVVKFEARWWSFLEPTHRLRFASKIRACFGYGADGGNGAVFDFGKDGLTSMRVNPGLSAYAEDPESACGSLRELLEFGKGRVPKDLWAEMEIRLMARAGLRLLDLGVQNRILNSCRKVLRSSGFKFRDEWASVITGTCTQFGMTFPICSNAQSVWLSSESGSSMLGHFEQKKNAQPEGEGEGIMLIGLEFHHISIQAVGSTVYAEEEVEYGLRNMTDSVRDTLAAMRSSPKFVLWQSPFYDVKSLKGIPDSYDEFTKLRLPVTLPLSSATLTGRNMEVDWGPIPTFNDLKQFIKENPCKMEESWNSMKEMCAEMILMKEILKPGQRNLNNSSSRHVQVPSKKRENSMFVTTKGNSLGGGTSKALKALGAYLRYLEGTERDHYWWEIHEQMPCAESRDGASFTTLWSCLFSFILSRRRVYFEALKYKKERDSGFLSPFGYSSATIAATVDSVCSMEWYLLLALKSQLSDDRRFCIRIWRWKGYLILFYFKDILCLYTVVGEEGPATLLVHGFGAFLEHYRDNIRAIAEGGNRVWAITLLGFGKSEKPNIEYTELMWAEMLRDFIIEVVGEPAHLVGNSIGGYIIAIVARLWPALVKSVVLINSGGNVIPGYSSVLFAKERRTSGASWLGAKFLLFCLRLTLKDIVKNCYPSFSFVRFTTFSLQKTERVDNWLIDEMLRAVSSSM